MSQIVNTLPALPDNLAYDNYILAYEPSTGKYILGNFDKVSFSVNNLSTTDDFHTKIYGHLWLSGRDTSFNVYSSDDSSDWTLFCSYNRDTDSYIGSVNYVFEIFDKHELVASSFDIYDSDGSVYCPATTDLYFNTSDIHVVSSTISPSTMLSAFSGVRLALPVVVFAVVLTITFRKVWSFFSGAVRGA